jgi:hypothetical protein
MIVLELIGCYIILIAEDLVDAEEPPLQMVDASAY